MSDHFGNPEGSFPTMICLNCFDMSSLISAIFVSAFAQNQYRATAN